jgi:hypothetical protein
MLRQEVTGLVTSFMMDDVMIGGREELLLHAFSGLLVVG